MHEDVLEQLVASGVGDLEWYDALIEQRVPPFSWTTYKYVVVSETIRYGACISDCPPQPQFARFEGTKGTFAVHDDLRSRLIESGYDKNGFDPELRLYVPL